MPLVQRRAKKKLKKKKFVEYLLPSEREVNMADAYGQVARGFFRHKGVKYT